MLQADSGGVAVVLTVLVNRKMSEEENKTRRWRHEYMSTKTHLLPSNTGTDADVYNGDDEVRMNQDCLLCAGREPRQLLSLVLFTCLRAFTTRFYLILFLWYQS